jgi:hypothetical protein
MADLIIEPTIVLMRRIERVRLFSERQCGLDGASFQRFVAGTVRALVVGVLSTGPGE